MLNYDRDEGETILKPQGWYNSINLPDTNAFTANQLDLTHDDFKAMTSEQEATVRNIKAELAKYAGGATHTLWFVLHIEVSHLSKLLIPSVQIGIQMYFNPWYIEVSWHFG